ncbi:MAG: hypothetical protein BWY76_03037 [bacterium ADurb.Bin429]|nr:MAG: hypothetical protein BWY76_03037 [bacterium ADurb.Bin429]
MLEDHAGEGVRFWTKDHRAPVEMDVAGGVSAEQAKTGVVPHHEVGIGEIVALVHDEAADGGIGADHLLERIHHQSQFRWVERRHLQLQVQPRRAGGDAAVGGGGVVTERIQWSRMNIIAIHPPAPHPRAVAAPLAVVVRQVDGAGPAVCQPAFVLFITDGQRIVAIGAVVFTPLQPDGEEVGGIGHAAGDIPRFQHQVHLLVVLQVEFLFKRFGAVARPAAHQPVAVEEQHLSQSYLRGDFHAQAKLCHIHAEPVGHRWDFRVGAAPVGIAL